MDMKNLPLEPAPSLGITVVIVVLLFVIFAFFMCGRTAKDEASMERALIIETTDVLFDWVTYVLAVYAGDLQFGNDPNNILRNIILVLCIFSTVACVVEVILYKHSKEHFRRIYLGSTCLHLLLEDGAQIVLYGIMGAANAATGRGYEVTLVLCGIAWLQSVVYFVVKVFELFKDSARTQEPTGDEGRPAPGQARPFPTTSDIAASSRLCACLRVISNFRRVHPDQVPERVPDQVPEWSSSELELQTPQQVARSQVNA